MVSFIIGMAIMVFGVVSVILAYLHIYTCWFVELLLFQVVCTTCKQMGHLFAEEHTGGQFGEFQAFHEVLLHLNLWQELRVEIEIKSLMGNLRGTNFRMITSNVFNSKRLFS